MVFSYRLENKKGTKERQVRKARNNRQKNRVKEITSH